MSFSCNVSHADTFHPHLMMCTNMTTILSHQEDLGPSMLDVKYEGLRGTGLVTTPLNMAPNLSECNVSHGGIALHFIYSEITSTISYEQYSVTMKPSHLSYHPLLPGRRVTLVFHKMPKSLSRQVRHIMSPWSLYFEHVSPMPPFTVTLLSYHSQVAKMLTLQC